MGKFRYKVYKFWICIILSMVVKCNISHLRCELPVHSVVCSACATSTSSANPVTFPHVVRSTTEVAHSFCSINCFFFLIMASNVRIVIPTKLLYLMKKEEVGYMPRESDARFLLTSNCKSCHHIAWQHDEDRMDSFTEFLLSKVSGVYWGSWNVLFMDNMG